MLNKLHEKQQGMELMILEQLVPQDHLSAEDRPEQSTSAFIRRSVRAAVQRGQLGRPADRPGGAVPHAAGGVSLRHPSPSARLEEEINYNMAYKWFCGLEPDGESAGCHNPEP